MRIKRRIDNRWMDLSHIILFSVSHPKVPHACSDVAFSFMSEALALKIHAHFPFFLTWGQFSLHCRFSTEIILQFQPAAGQKHVGKKCFKRFELSIRSVPAQVQTPDTHRIMTREGGGKRGRKVGALLPLTPVCPLPTVFLHSACRGPDVSRLGCLAKCEEITRA